MTATATSDAGSDESYNHWPDDATQLSAPSAAGGYDANNGLRSHTYVPTVPTPASPKTAPAPVPQVIYYAQPQIYAYGSGQYTYGPPAHQPAYYAPAPGYYGYGYGYPQQAPVQQQPQVMAAPYHVYYPPQQAAVAPAPAPVAQNGNVWVGRTKAQVKEDNEALAKREGANDKRKVAPVGVKDDQLMWCVEVDGGHTLRTFMDIKELKGEWKKDPRFEDSYFFVREKEEEKEKK